MTWDLPLFPMRIKNCDGDSKWFNQQKQLGFIKVHSSFIMWCYSYLHLSKYILLLHHSIKGSHISILYLMFVAETKSLSPLLNYAFKSSIHIILVLLLKLLYAAMTHENEITLLSQWQKNEPLLVLLHNIRVLWEQVESIYHQSSIETLLPWVWVSVNITGNHFKKFKSTWSH